MNNVLTIQRTGRKSEGRATECQDRLLARILPLNDGEAGYLLAVADGITNCAFGGSVAKWVIDRHLAEDRIDFLENEDRANLFRDYLSALYATFQSEFSDMADMLMSGCCLVAMIVVRNKWVCCSVGDCPAFILTKAEKGFDGRQITRPHIDRFSGALTDCFGNHAPCSYNVYEGEIAPGDVLVLTSDGAKLDEVSLSADLNQLGFTDQWLKEIAERAMCSRFWDDISVVAHQSGTSSDK